VDPAEVLAAYPEEWRSGRVLSMGTLGGFSGATFWRIDAREGLLCLRRWPPGNPSEEGIRFIHAVLQHVARTGFDLVPVPLQTVQGVSYVRDGECFWELSPWMAGKADSTDRPSPARIAAAMVALAGFHRAAQGFPISGRKSGRSAGIGDRLHRARQWLSGGLDELSALLTPTVCPRLFERARRVLALAGTTGPALVPRLEAAADEQVPLQPCIRDVWRNHVLFQGDRVSGLIDFGSLAVDNVATDVARLLGSLAGDEPELRRLGLSAYGSVRPLGDAEAPLVEAFDQSTVVLSGLNWCDWIYRQHRTFADWGAVEARLDEIARRLESLARQCCGAKHGQDARATRQSL